MKNLFKKYLTQKVRNILSICIIIFGLIYIINYSFYRPTYINKYIAMNIYKSPANNAFTDQNFYNCVIDAYNSENNTSLGYTTNLSDSQLKKITNLYCYNKGVINSSGLDKMTSLIYLNLNNNQLTDIDVSKNAALTSLNLYSNKLVNLDISKNILLTDLSVAFNQLTSLNINNNVLLDYLELRGNKLTSINVSNNTKLVKLFLNNNQLSSINIDNNTLLTNFSINNNQLASINVNKNTNLITLDVSGNKICELDVSKNIQLTNLYIDKNQLTSIDLINNIELIDLSVNNNKIVSIDVGKNTNLKYLNVGSNKLETIDLSKNTKLLNVNLYINQLKNVDLSNNVLLTHLWIGGNQLSILDTSKNTALKEIDAFNNQLTNIDVSKNTPLTNLNVSDNQLTNLDVSKNISLADLNVSNNQLTNLYLGKNTALTSLIAYSNILTNIELGKNDALTSIDLHSNQLNILDISNISNLKKLYASWNKLTNLNVTKNAKLTYLAIYSNQLTDLDVGKNTLLTELDVGDNQLENLDVSNLTSLLKLNVSNNQLTELDVSKNLKMVRLDAYSNKLMNLNTNTLTLLEILDLRFNKLTSINLTNNTKLNWLNLNNNNFSNVLTRYVGDSGNANSAVKLPSHLEHDITWKSSDESIAVSDSDGNITTKKVGTVNIVGTNKYYTTKTIVNVFEMTFDKYVIDNENLYIYVSNDNDVDTIKNNINLPDYVTPNIDLNNNKIELVKDGYVLKEFKIVRINSKNYKIGSDYIYTRHYSDISGLSCYNCNASIEDNNVIIKYNDIEIDRFKLVKFSNKYTLYCIGCSDGAGIYTGMDNDAEIINNLAIINGNTIIDNNILKITYNNKVLEEFDIRGFSTNYKILDNNVLYTGFNEFNINGISYRGDKITGKYSNNKFTVLYDDIATMGSYDVITLSGNNINVTRKNISTEEIDYNTFINNLGNIDNISYKVIYNNEEVTNGDINPGSILNIYYKDKLIDKYRINSTDTFEIDESVSVIEEKEIINNIEVGFSRDNLFDKINTNGEIFLLDKEGNVIEENTKIKTGYIFRTIFDNDLDNPLDYRLSVKGDVLGTGELSRDNAKEIAKHIIDKNVINGDEYLLAADYNNDGKIKMNDVVKILRDKRKQENP